MGILSKILGSICKKSNIIEKITQKIFTLQKKVPGASQHKDIKSLLTKSNNTTTYGSVTKNGNINSIWTENEKMLNANDWIGKQVNSLMGKEVQTFSTKAVHEGAQNIRRYQLFGGYLESIIKPYNSTFKR